MPWVCRIESPQKVGSIDDRVPRTSPVGVSSMTAVSAIIACHNGERFIRQAIDSVLAQGVVGLELIVADDGSSDRSPEIVAGYGPPVSLVRVVHGNTQATRNAAIAASRGAMIGILDQDDTWHPDKLRRQIACLDRNPELGLCYTDTRAVDPSGRALAERHNPLFCPRDQRAALGRLLCVNVMAASSVLIRRSAMDRVGSFDPTFHLAGDWDLWLRVAEAFPIACVPEPLVDYGWHGDNLSRGRIGMLRESIAVQQRALERVSHHPRWGSDPGLKGDMKTARLRLASRFSELGSVLSKSGDRSGALQALSRAIAIDPRPGRHWSRLLRAWIRRSPGTS